MKKKAMIFAIAAAMVLSLAACGSQGGTNGGGSADPGSGSTSTHENGGTNNSGTTNGNTGSTGTNGSGTTRSRGTLRGDVGGAMDDAGRAVDDLVDDVTGQRTAGMTSFQRMLDNARVHDADGILTK